MRRVAVIGCGGAGKTTLALELGRILDLPGRHVDAVYWRGRSREPSEAWPVIHRALVTEPRWVIEGMKPGLLGERLARADTVVFLDLPRRTCLRGVVERRIAFGRRPRPDTGRPDRLTWPCLRRVGASGVTCARSSRPPCRRLPERSSGCGIAPRSPRTSSDCAVTVLQGSRRRPLGSAHIRDGHLTHA